MSHAAETIPSAKNSLIDTVNKQVMLQRLYSEYQDQLDMVIEWVMLHEDTVL